MVPTVLPGYISPLVTSCSTGMVLGYSIRDIRLSPALVPRETVSWHNVVRGISICLPIRFSVAISYPVLYTIL